MDNILFCQQNGILSCLQRVVHKSQYHLHNRCGTAVSCLCISSPNDELVFFRYLFQLLCCDFDCLLCYLFGCFCLFVRCMYQLGPCISCSKNSEPLKCKYYNFDNIYHFYDSV